MNSPRQPGDIFLLQEIRRRDGYPGDITTPDRALEAEVALALGPLSAPDLGATFGPGWKAVVVVVRQAAALTKRQTAALTAAWEPSDFTRNDAWIAASAAASAASAKWTVTWTAASIAAWDAAAFAADGEPVCSPVAVAVARAATTRHLIGNYGYTETHYDALVSAWVSVMGDPFAVEVSL